jgi:prepilin-type N-terminal cleavage/methylation domain-containing protein
MSHRTPVPQRAGYTTIEMILAVVIMGVLFAIAMPRFTAMKTSTSLRAGRQQLGSMFATARAAALLKGKTAEINFTSSTVTVRVQSGLASSWVTVAGPMRFDQLGLTFEALASSPMSVSYNARGLLSPTPAQDLQYRLTSASSSDTLCISRAGIIMQKGCTL